MSTTFPAISVVVPLYNKERYILRCLESIRRQTFSDYEVIVVDDGSSDRGGALAAAFPDPRFRVVEQKNRGEGGARNRGISESRGALIAFLDGDDEWEPGFLEAVAGLSRQFPQAGILATGLRRVDGEAYDLETTFKSGGTGHASLIEKYFYYAKQGNFVSSSSVAIPRSVFEEVGVFLEGEPIGADRDMWVRIALRHPIAYDSRVLAIYHTDATGRSFSRWKSNPPYPPAARTLRRFLDTGALPPAKRRDATLLLDWLLLRHAYWLLDLGKHDTLLRHLKEESFSLWTYRWRARLLRSAASVVPVRLLSAVKCRAVLLGARIRRMLGSLFSAGRYEWWFGRRVVSRQVPAHSRVRTVAAQSL
ncbi:MAG: glycosyltransferase family 2 protein [Bryobacterales bacterium]|nr:glycosyltransferase family 2 protein [Bryobacterales bacterium]